MRLDREQIKKNKRWDKAKARSDRMTDDITAKVSNHIKHVDDFIKEFPNINQGILLCRVSKRDQDRNGNLRRQAKGTKAKYTEMGIEVVETYKETGSGSNPLNERPILEEAVRKAGTLDLPLLIPCTSRLLRNVNWKSIDPCWLPMEDQYEEFIKLLKKYKVSHVISYLDPDASPEEDKGFLSLLSRTVTGKQHQGRKRNKYPGYKKDQKANSIELVKQLYSEGQGCRRITKAIQRLTGFPIHRVTILQWVA